MPDMKTLTIDEIEFKIVDSESVHFTKQELTEGQKEQARRNIAAMRSGEVYTLKDDETIEDAPAWAQLVIDPDAEAEDEDVVVESEIVVERTSVNASYDGESINGELHAKSELIAGKTYKVTFNGEVYECIACHPQNDSDDGTNGVVYDDYVVIGNYDHFRWVLPECVQFGNGEPFAIDQYDGNTTLYVSAEDDYEVEVAKETVTIKPEYMEAIKAALPTVEMVATFEDGTTTTYKLYGEAVTE